MGSTGDQQRFRTLQAALRSRRADGGSSLEKLARGELSADEVSALRTEAESSEGGALDFELYRPLDADEKARIFESVRARVRAEAGRRWKLRMAAGGAAMAMVAALAPLYLRTRVEVTWGSSLAPGAEAVLRLEEPGKQASLTIVPLHQFDGKLQVRGAAFVQNGRAIPWEPHPTSEDNQIRISGSREDLFPCLKGEGRILVAVGVPGPWLSPSDLEGHEGRDWTGRYQVLGKPVFLGDQPVAGKNGKPCP
jgi:hypothetical protein